MKPLHQRIAVSIVFCAALVNMVVSCGQTSATPVAAPSPSPTIRSSPSATLTPPSPTATTVPVRPTATPATVNVTSTPAAKLQTDNLEFTAPVTEDDMDPVIPVLQNLNGVTEVRAGGNGLQITYDPSKLTRKQIIDTIEAFGFHIKP